MNNITSSTSTNLDTLFLPPRPSQFRRPRLKPNLALRSQSSPFDGLFHDLFSSSSSNSINFIAPALGFASSVALYLSNRSRKSLRKQVSEIREWVLFTSPIPFNRFVLLRCPSISFEGSELLEDVNERLLKEDRHFVSLDSGRMQLGAVDGARWAE